MPVPLYQAKAEFFRMLGHPVRIRVLELLSELVDVARLGCDDVACGQDAILRWVKCCGCSNECEASFPIRFAIQRLIPESDRVIGAAPENCAPIFFDVVPRTIESSIKTTRLPLIKSRTGLSLMRTPKERIDCRGSMNVRPT